MRPLLQTWNTRELPDTVTTDKNKFLADSMDTEYSTSIDRTSGVPVYLFLDMHGMNDHPVRVVFNTGASNSLWLSTAIMDYRL